MRRYLTRFVLPLLLLGTAPTLSASLNTDWEKSQYSEHMAKRLRLYEDALEWTKDIEDESTRVITRAKVYRIWSDNLSGKSRREKRNLALEELKKLTTDSGVVAYARMALDLIEEDGFPAGELNKVKAYDTEDPDLAAERAESIYHTVWDRKELMLEAVFEDDTLYEDRVWITNLIACYELMLRTQYFAIRMMPDLTVEDREAREQVLFDMRNLFNEMRFEQESAGYMPEPFFNAFLVLGNTQRILGSYELAITQFMEINDLLKSYPATNPLVSYQSLRATLRALTVLLNDFGNDGKRIQRARDIIAATFLRFPHKRRSPQGRQLELMDVQASLKLGEDATKALKLLLEMARDRSSLVFQIRAAKALGDVAQIPSLTIDQRVECVKAIVAVNSPETNQVAVMVMHSVLEAIDSEKSYEAYAPLCYASIGHIYEGMGRFYDAANAFYEGSQRFIYFSKNNPTWSESSNKLPAHFFGADKQPIFAPIAYSGKEMKLETEGDAFNLSKLLSERAAANATFLNSARHGAAGIPAFEDLKREIDEWNAQFLGLTALYRQLTSEGLKAFGTDPLKAAYILINTLPEHGAAGNNAYLAGHQFGTYALGKNEPKWNDFSNEMMQSVLVGEGEQTLQGVETSSSEIVFKSHLNRVNDDFAALPEWLRGEISKDITETAEYLRKVAKNDNERTWWLAMYCYRRSAYFTISDDMARLSGMGFSMDTPMSFTDTVLAWAEFSNSKGILSLPPSKRVASKKMFAVAKNFNQLDYTMRQTPTQSTSRAETLRVGLDEKISQLGSMMLKAFLPHLEAMIAAAENADDEDEDTKKAANNAKTMLQNFIVGEFDHNVGSGRPSLALDSLNVYRRNFYNSATGSDKTKARAKVKSMLSRLYNAMIRDQSPNAAARNLAASRMEQYAFQILKGSFTQTAINKLLDTKPDASLKEQHKAALDFLRSEMIKRNFDSNKQLQEYLKDYDARREAFVTAFDGLVAKYRGLQKERLSAKFTAWAADSANASIKGEIEKGLGQVNAGKVYDGYATLKAATIGKDASIRILESEALQILRYFGDGVGTAFQGELTGHMNTLAENYRREASERILEYLTVSDTYREFADAGEQEIKDERVKAFAGFNQAVATHLGDNAEWWQRSYDLWKRQYGILLAQNKISDPAFIDLDTEKQRLVDDAALAEEFEVRFHLGKSAMNLWRLKKFPTDGVLYEDARDNLRRLYNICQWGIGINKDMRDKRYYQNLGDSETLKKVDSMIFHVAKLYRTFGDLHVANKITPKWESRRYYRQNTINVTKADAEAQEESERFWLLPETELDWLNDHNFLYFTLSKAFKKDGGPFNALYQEFMSDWAEISQRRLELGGFNVGEIRKDSAGNVEITTAAREEHAKLMIGYLRSDFSLRRFAVADNVKAFFENSENVLKKVAEGLPAGNATRKQIEETIK